MEYTNVAGSGLSVSKFCLGTMMFGGQTDEKESIKIVDYALDNGINFFDTAIVYQDGTSEEYVGRALKDFARRDEVVVATKFLPRSTEEIGAGVTGQEHIEKQLNLSLAHLGMDYVDLYIYHMCVCNAA